MAVARARLIRFAASNGQNVFCPDGIGSPLGGGPYISPRDGCKLDRYSPSVDLSPVAKRKILGLNAAKLYCIDVEQQKAKLRPARAAVAAQ